MNPEQGRCKSCKWWASEYKNLIHGNSFHYCANSHFVYGNGPYDEGNQIKSNDCVYSDINDGFCDVSPSEGEVITGPDFGCIHHEPKEKG